MDDKNKQLNDEGRELWNQKAEFWDNLHGQDGNDFHRELISPPVESLLNIEPGELVLDIGCGSGVMARRLAQLGAKVTACDFSAALVERARMRESVGEPIDYHVVDATDAAALLSLGEGKFDAIVCTMAVMDMPVVAPMFRAVHGLLKENGRFVFASAHPAFNSNNPVFVAEVGDDDGEVKVTHSVKLKGYLDIPPVKGSGAPNEPNPHYYYHRPMHELFGSAFAAGFTSQWDGRTSFPQKRNRTSSFVVESLANPTCNDVSVGQISLMKYERKHNTLNKNLTETNRNQNIRALSHYDYYENDRFKKGRLLIYPYGLLLCEIEYYRVTQTLNN